MNNQEIRLPDDAIAALADMDVRGDATSEQVAMLSANTNIERWRQAVSNLKRETQTRCAEIKGEMALKEQECWRKGPTGKSEWFAYKAKQSAKLARASAILNAIDARLAYINPRLKELHRKQSMEQVMADKREWFTLKQDIENSSQPKDAAYLLRVIERLASAIVPLSSLDYLLTSSARDDTHLAAYKSVRLKVADIREARAAWLEAQTVIGGEKQEDEGA